MSLRLNGCLGLGLALSLAAATACWAAAVPPAAASKPAASKPVAEDDGKKADPKEDPHTQLDEELSETSGSPADIIMILERHLKTHADCNKRNEILRVLAQLAVEMKDSRRVVLYGPDAIDRGTLEPRLLEMVTRTLLERDDPASHVRALKYATLQVVTLRSERDRLLQAKNPEPGQGRHLEESENALAQALVYEARAHLATGDARAALASSDAGWAIVPLLELALERARALEALGRFADALDAASDAFVVEDGRATAKDRQAAREMLAVLGPKAQLDPAARVLAAWDRSRELIAAHGDRLRAYDPNTAATTPLEFTMSKLDGGKLALASVKGKVVVFDFWATWCGPCRVQHPLYEQVKEHFKGNANVVFLPVATDEDRSLVKPFLERQKWSHEVLLDDGLAAYFRVSSIPTTIVLNKRGEMASRMPGFVPERFVEMLTARIEAALADN
jgi:thiol-disulfide isomerase/thioredoxin